MPAAPSPGLSRALPAAAAAVGIGAAAVALWELLPRARDLGLPRLNPHHLLPFAGPKETAALIALLVLAAAAAAAYWGLRRLAPAAPRAAAAPARPVRSSGNAAFDAFRADTLRRLEEEQAAFEDFLERLRAARDKAEFDRFLDERAHRARDRTPGAEAPGPRPGD